MTSSFSIVIPTLGRPSLQALLDTLAAQSEPPVDVVVVDDRPHGGPPLDTSAVPAARVVRGHGLGPAHARNTGWRLTRGDWVVFVDDDVLLTDGWSLDLVADLVAARPDMSGAYIGGVQARLEVPLPADRRPTDWERGTAGLASAAYVTAEMAYRRDALEMVDGFDERFPRAFREDADLALRVMAAGWQLARGRRLVVHPVRPSDPWASLRQQRGNADDALMLRLHGFGWRARALSSRGRLPLHLLTTGAALTAVGALASLRWRVAGAALAAWAALTGEFAWKRIAPGPRTDEEVRAMLLTSLAIPPVAVWHRLVGTWRTRRAPGWRPPLQGVLFDRDGTLVVDVPYNHDPARVELVPGAAAAVARLRAAGLKVGMVTNQSAVARGLASLQQVRAVNERVEQLVGPLDTVRVCPHGEDDGCECRKPAPGMVLDAAAELGLAPYELAVVGDIGADVEAALAAGARGVLVPNPVTKAAEVSGVAVRADTLDDAVQLLLERP